MKVREHRASDMITKLAPVTFNAKAKCPLWLDCLNTWMDGDTEKIDYLQRLGGYCLTGDVSARVFPIFCGSGLNGKSVFCNTLLGLMGDHATIAPKSLLSQRVTDEHPCDVAKLRGMRLVIAHETRPGMKLRVDMVKAMTGEQKLTGRFMRQDYFDFCITHKIVLMTNNLPVIEDASDAIWDRVHLVEWPVRIPDEQVNPHLLDDLKLEWPGILNWLLAGCGKWLKADKKLVPPAAIRTATQEYREDSNPLSGFMEDCCTRDGNSATSVKALRQAYEAWASENNVKFPISPRRFNNYFREIGLQYEPLWQSGKAVKCWKGIGLREN